MHSSSLKFMYVLVNKKCSVKNLFDVKICTVYIQMYETCFIYFYILPVYMILLMPAYYKQRKTKMLKKKNEIKNEIIILCCCLIFIPVYDHFQY